MATLRLAGHQHSYAASDVLRLFFGTPRATAPDTLQAGPAEPLAESRLTAAGPGEFIVATRLGGIGSERRVMSGQASREVKRQLYEVLSAYTGQRFPWGSLTGIRPTLVAGECLAAAHSIDEAKQELTERWFVSPDKAELALETALAEKALLSRIPAGSAFVYIGVPFCPSRCAYCSFITQDAPSRAALLEPYVEAVIRESRLVSQMLPSIPAISAVYFGGGTPTSLPDTLFDRLLSGVMQNIPLVKNAELTVEAGRPDTITPVKLSAILSAGATRLCINPQTFHDKTLVQIGRRHTTEQTIAAFGLARSMGFHNINMDLIAGLPGESPADFADSMEQALVLRPDSVTVHTLSIKRAARLRHDNAPESETGFRRLDSALADMVSFGGQRLRQAGLEPYYLYRQKDTVGGLENTGYARPGEGCLYNVGMMSDRITVIGLGSGAMTKAVGGSRVERLANPKDIGVYIGRLDESVERKQALFQRNESILRISPV